MLYEGEVLQVIEEMKQAKDENIKNKDDAVKEINYFLNNKNRMDYALYRENGYPVGSGLVEGSCKLVINRRFKGNGTRWKKRDNKQVLRVRLAVLNSKNPPAKQVAFLPKHAEEFKGKAFRLKKLHYE